MNWDVICAHCGKLMPINSLMTHFKNKHGWRTRADGSIDPHSNPLWRNGGIIP